VQMQQVYFKHTHISTQTLIKSIHVHIRACTHLIITVRAHILVHIHIHTHMDINTNTHSHTQKLAFS
jgi:hypothetical protein